MAPRSRQCGASAGKSGPLLPLPHFALLPLALLLVGLPRPLSALASDTSSPSTSTSAAAASRREQALNALTSELTSDSIWSDETEIPSAQPASNSTGSHVATGHVAGQEERAVVRGGPRSLKEHLQSHDSGVGVARIVPLAPKRLKHPKKALAALLAKLSQAGIYSAQQDTNSTSTTQAVPKIGLPGGVKFWPGLGTSAVAGPLLYRDGKVMTGHITVYPIFYGSWSGNFGQNVLRDFVLSVSKQASHWRGIPTVKDWWRIQAPYYMVKGGKRVPMAMDVRMGKWAVVNKGFKKHLSDFQESKTNGVQQIVMEQIRSGALPDDPNGYYPVMTSAEITVGPGTNGFCGYYCGWHSMTTSPGGKNIKYGFVGDATKQCNTGCRGNLLRKKTANGHYSIDSLMSVFAHELAETASDPDSTSPGFLAKSYSMSGISGQENADLCNFDFTGGERLPRFGPKLSYAYNMQGINGRLFLIQSNVDIKTQKCVMRRK